MSNFYKNIRCDNFQEIRHEVLSVFPKYLHNINSFYSPRDNIDMFFKLPILSEYLASFGFVTKDTVKNFGLNIMDPKSNIGIHTDNPSNDDSITYSLNIPLVAYDQSIVTFYKINSDRSPSLKGYAATAPSRNVYYAVYDPEDVILLETHNVTVPHILDTSVPHDVLNDCDEERVTLLIKLSSAVNDSVRAYTGLPKNNR